jgi:hypothetical protein
VGDELSSGDNLTRFDKRNKDGHHSLLQNHSISENPLSGKAFRTNTIGFSPDTLVQRSRENLDLTGDFL